MGSVPLGYRDATLLHTSHFHGVVNMCREYNECAHYYQLLNIQQCHCPTPDFVEPQMSDILKAIRFIVRLQQQQQQQRHGNGNESKAGAVVGTEVDILVDIVDTEVDVDVDVAVVGTEVDILVDIVDTEVGVDVEMDTTIEHNTDPDPDPKPSRKRVYIHCKGGRGRAVTIATCYLLYKHRHNPTYTIPYVIDLIKHRRSCASVAVGRYKVVHAFVDLLRQHDDLIEI
mgnify:CR=1 FL=1